MNFLTGSGKLTFPWSALVALTLMSNPAIAQQVPPPPRPDVRTLTTHGHSEIKVRPDSLSVNITVETPADTLSKARSDNNRKMQEIIKTLKALNISGMKMETEMLTASPVQGEPQKNKLPKVIGYQVTNSLDVIVTGANPDSLGDSGSRIVDSALDAGATNVGGLNFFVNDLSTPQANALALAVKNAKNNAQAMATAADVQLNGVYRIDNPPQFGGLPHPPGMMMRAMALGSSAAPAPVESGEVTVTSDITVVYKIQNP